MTPEVRRGINSWIVKASLSALGYWVIIFLAAGRLDWLWGWLLWGVLAAMLLAHPLLLIPINPELLAERAKGTQAQDVKPWDKRITMAVGLLMIASWIVAGLDVRFGWMQGWPVILNWTGFTLAIIGYAIFMWAMVSNPFFSEGVRIQPERGHTVVSTGPYRIVRHPGYAGAILAQLVTPLLLGSSWAMIPSGILGVLLVMRTHLEDQTLAAELPGYREYQDQTHSKLIPGVW